MADFLYYWYGLSGRLKPNIHFEDKSNLVIKWVPRTRLKHEKRENPGFTHQHSYLVSVILTAEG